MGRPRKTIETPGQETKVEPEDIAGDVQLLNSLPVNAEQEPANTPEQLNAATAGATVLESTETPNTDISARNEALSGLNAEAFGIVSKFESYGFEDEQGNPLTNCLDFIEMVKRATTATSNPVTSTDGQRKAFKAPVMTEKGWHVHS